MSGDDDFQLFPPAQMRWLATPEARWTRPAISLEAYLRGQKQKGGRAGPTPAGGISAVRNSRGFEFEPANTSRCA